MRKHCVLALGFFDGVHLGHKALLCEAARQAVCLKTRAAVLTFDAHPDEIISGRRVGLINSRKDQKTLLLQNGADEVFYLHFDKAMMELPYQTFLSEVLFSQYQPAYVVCGHDFRFGRYGEGTAELLRQACEENDIGCSVIQAVKLDGQTVSSTAIRTLLSQGEIEQASRLLGHGQFYSGTVKNGQRLGRTLGIPTANLCFEDGVLLPRLGVYSCKVCADGSTYPAVCNIGRRPTVGGRDVTLEAHLLGFSGDLYGKEICVQLCRFLRSEQKFDSLDALKEQISRDEEAAREDFGECHG